MSEIDQTIKRHPSRARVSLAATVAVIASLITPAATAASVGSVASVGFVASSAPPAAAYSCSMGGNNTVAGTFGDAGLIGWAGDTDGVIACLGGSFYVRSGKDTTYGYGLYNYAPTKWTRAAGFLPALTTSFAVDGAAVSITNFADMVTVAGQAYVAVYSRVSVHNPTSSALTIDPRATPGLIPLGTPVATSVTAGATVNHDYVVAVDRLGASYPWPADDALGAAGGYDTHFDHMAAFWNGQLAQIAQISHLPDPTLINAYRAGFIDTEIIRDGTQLNTGENGYDKEYSHDVIGILANLFTQGDFADAHALLAEASLVIGTQAQYADALWTYSWPWAVYLMKTGDLAFVKANFNTAGPLGATEPSIESTAHQIAADRTGPGGIMQETNDIDSNGYWTIDNYEALMGLAAYRWIAVQVGDTTEATWATQQYSSLLTATNSTLDQTINIYHLNYLPCSMIEPNTANRCANPVDANWASPFLFGRWAWDAGLFGAQISGPGFDLIDATYRYGFDRLKNKLPANTFGGYSPDFWSTAYNAGYGSWGLAAKQYRDQGILSYQWMIAHDQSGPFSWWESASSPNTGSPWAGDHPSSGNGSAPHAWGIANANKVLLDSLVAQRSDGSLLIGRGVPDKWVANGDTEAVSNFPTTQGHRLGVEISTSGTRVTLRLTGAAPDGPVLFELPAFVANISSVRVGLTAAADGSGNTPPPSLDNRNGVVSFGPSVRSISVQLRHAA